MSKTLTEQWREGTLPEGWYYTIIKGFTDKEKMMIDYYIPELHHFEIKPTECIKEVLAPVPSYRALYGPNDGNMPTGVFTVLKIIKRDIDNAQKRRSLTDLECGIKSQVVSLLKKWGVK